MIHYCNFLEPTSSEWQCVFSFLYFFIEKKKEKINKMCGWHPNTRLYGMHAHFFLNSRMHRHYDCFFSLCNSNFINTYKNIIKSLFVLNLWKLKPFSKIYRHHQPKFLSYVSINVIVYGYLFFSTEGCIKLELFFFFSIKYIFLCLNTQKFFSSYINQGRYITTWKCWLFCSFTQYRRR